MESREETKSIKEELLKQILQGIPGEISEELRTKIDNLIIRAA